MNRLNTQIMKKIISPLLVIVFCSSLAAAQVPVREEPFHQNVLENKYIRLLDVRIKPGDTTLFHIHATPSLFLHFTSTLVCVQIKGNSWTKGKNKEGNASYTSFVNDTLVHRVSNCDTVPFHVTDIEILSSYKPATGLKPLPFTVLFKNEKALAYRLSNSSLTNQMINGRGPMVAELVAGDEVIYYDTMNKRSTKIKTGKYLYIEPGSSFYFSAKESKEINMVLFEIK
jgi:quercetin dioxygenase-like cupin family protein